MCGIAGFLDGAHGADIDRLRNIAARMGESLRHRGPTSGGAWTDEAAGVAFAHRRLAIIDVSDAGHQPMMSADKRYVISFNGEIYNHRAIRADLEAAGLAPEWRGHSDTETILAAVTAWGVQAAIPHLGGMFAFALWDRTRRSLHLVRDRIGEKPLYYGRVGGAFLFGSELKALRCHPAWTGEIDRGALSLYVRHGYVPAPHSINANVYKLPPGTFLTLEWGRSDPVIQPYWSLQDVVKHADAHPFNGGIGEAVDGLETLMRKVVLEQMISDVPLGAFLSGGLDSSTIVALMQAQSRDPVRTFTIGFHEKPFDEAVHARAIAKHLGTEHTELYVRPKEALDAVSLMPHFYDEPFGDSSQLPTYLLARLATANVKVALSGDGGDEVFGGYDRYGRAESLLDRVAKLPATVRRVLGAGIGALSPEAWDWVLRPAMRCLPVERRRSDPGDKLGKWGSFLSLDRAEMYRLLSSHCLNPAALVIGGWEPPTSFTDASRWNPDSDFQSAMMALDLVSYLPDDILVKVDRAAMALGLETRIPLLDPRIIEYVWSLPLAYRAQEGKSKWMLRQVLYRHVPPSLVDRPKKGFSMPIDLWLRGPLRDWAESLLDRRRIRDQGMLDARRVERMWHDFLAGADAGTMIWNILMYQGWMDETTVQAPKLTMKVA